MPKLKIAWFSKLNIGTQFSDSLGAYLSEVILPQLRNEFDFTLYHNSFETFQDFPTHHFLKAFEHHKKEPYDIFFYNLENRSYANFVRSHIGLIPGITYFHDFILSNYGPEPLLNSPYRAIVSKLLENGTEWPARDAKHKPSGPLAFREATLSPIAIFSNEQNLNEYRHSVELPIAVDLGTETNSFFLPYPINATIPRSRSTQSPFKIAYAASPQIEGRAHKVFAALSEIESDYKLIWMVDPSEKSQAEEILREFSKTTVELVAEKSPQCWTRITEDADVAIHTHFSVYGHLQPYLGISLMRGLPCLVSNFGSAEYLSDKLVFKIQPGETEAFEIAEVLKGISENKLEINKDRIHSYAQEIFDSKQVALELAQILRNKASYLRSVSDKWGKLEGDARAFLLKESFGLIVPDENKDSQLPEICKSQYTFDHLIAPIFKELQWTQE